MSVSRATLGKPRQCDCRHRSEHAEFRIEQHRDRDEIRDRLKRLRVA